jgi:hypothetical protein
MEDSPSQTVPFADDRLSTSAVPFGCTKELLRQLTQGYYQSDERHHEGEHSDVVLRVHPVASFGRRATNIFFNGSW